MRFQGRDAARGRRMRKDLGRTAGAGVALALVLFLMPALLVRQGEFSQELLPQGTLPLHRTPSSVSAASQDRGRVVRLSRSDGTVEELTMEEYLWGVVAAEMPASFEEEALKAQACAARTYTVTLQEASSPRTRTPRSAMTAAAARRIWTGRRRRPAGGPMRNCTAERSSGRGGDRWTGGAL